MAKFNVPNYTSADGFGLPLNIRRGNPNPLDNSSVWMSLEAAQNYAKTDPIAYVGQVLTVVEFSAEDVDKETPVAATVYAIQNEAGDLARVGTITLGDDQSIVKNADNTLSIKGYADAAAGAQLTKTADGLAWIVPSTTTVEGLQASVAGLTTRMENAETAINNRYTKAEVDSKIASVGHLKRVVVAALPEVADADADTIYMIKDANVTSGDAYKEYMLIDGAFVQIGDTSVDLSAYAKTDDVNDAITEATNDLATAASVTELGETVVANKTAAEDAIALKADQTTVDGIDDRLEAAETTITALPDTYAAKTHGHQISEITDLQETLNAKAAALDLTNLTSTVEGKADKGTTLEDYGITDAYTAAETDSKIADAVKSATGGESAASVLAELNAYKTANDTEVGNLKTADTTLQGNIDTVAGNLATHTGDTTIHITADERTQWNAAEANILENITSTTLNVGTNTDKSLALDIQWGEFN